ncbi:hypothetical protein AB0D84_21960 [Streptomyces sp. NPDC048193]|uniref:SCO2400 family protein n=1 Tax=unclassified Streptomyces TaxID=2593676 RepID=UPI0034446B88
MDYCSTCRRHLNGALVCPGCGAYAPDIAPPTTYSDTATPRGTAPATPAGAPASPPAGRLLPPGALHHRPLHDEADLGPGTATAPAAATGGTPPTGLGRAARRRQLARWKKGKRRAAVATAVAIVGGGLTVTTLDRHSTDRAQAAAAPDERSMGVAQEQIPDRAQPTPAPPAADQPSRTSAPPRSSVAATARQQPQAAPASAAPPNARPATAAPPRRVTAPHPASPATTLQPTAPPAPSAPAAQDPSDTATQPPATAAPADPPRPGTSPTDPAPAPATPTKVCLLVLCLG